MGATCGKKDRPETPLIDRLTLHAYQLRIPIGLSEDAESRTFMAPLDKKFAAAVKMLAKYSHGPEQSEADRQVLDTILAGGMLPFLLDADAATE